jgi:hypothetical protein
MPNRSAASAPEPSFCRGLSRFGPDTGGLCHQYPDEDVVARFVAPVRAPLANGVAVADELVVPDLPLGVPLPNRADLRTTTSSAR